MRQVELEPYNAAWPRFYSGEALVLSLVLGTELVTLHHIGSTSVPGLKAKPIIDMLAAVRDLEKLDSLNGRMTSEGYLPRGEYGIPGRRYFFKGTGDKHTFHLHAFQNGDPQIERHFLFRDYLRSHHAAAEEYAQLKEILAARFPRDVNAYTAGKDDFIKSIDKKAAAWSKTRSMGKK